MSYLRRAGGERRKNAHRQLDMMHALLLLLFLFLFQTHAHTYGVYKQHTRGECSSGGKSGYTRFNGGACSATSVSLEKRFMGQTLLLCWDNRTLSPTPFPNRPEQPVFLFPSRAPWRASDAQKKKHVAGLLFRRGFTSTWKGHFWILHASPFLYSPVSWVSALVRCKRFFHITRTTRRLSRVFVCHKFVASSSNACFETRNGTL